jgi:hypothetical protein
VNALELIQGERDALRLEVEQLPTDHSTSPGRAHEFSNNVRRGALRQPERHGAAVGATRRERNHR